MINKTKKGFTLIELIVVVVVLAILAAVAVPMVSGWVKTAEENAAKANARTIEVALKAYMAEESLANLTVTTAKKALEKYDIGELKTGTPPAGDTGRYIKDSKKSYKFSTIGAVVIENTQGGNITASFIASDSGPILP